MGRGRRVILAASAAVGVAVTAGAIAYAAIPSAADSTISGC